MKDMMSMVYDIYIQNFEIIVFGITGIALIIAFLAIIRANRMAKRYNKFMKQLSEKDIETMLVEYMTNVKTVEKEMEETKRSIEEVKNITKHCFQKYGIVRYTAFEDVGSDLSFAVALLDGDNDGVILNGIYSREGSSTFAKPIHKGNQSII
jgi:hypothetical protein